MYRHPRSSSGTSFPGKWRRLPHSGVGTVLTESDGTWEIQITHRQSGSSIRRDVYSATIRGQQPRHEEFLTGFRSHGIALEAARRRVRMLKSLAERAARRRAATSRRA